MLRRVLVVVACVLLVLLPIRYLLTNDEDAWADARAKGPIVAKGFFGMQAIPKFDEAKGKGSWAGSRARGLAMHEDLGVQLSREGYLWQQDEPTPGAHPNQADFDDAIARCRRAGIEVELMVTDTPYWASSAPGKRPDQPDTYRHAPPSHLYDPIFSDGTDQPGPDKHLNPKQYWGRMLARVAGRYRSEVRYYQIWNEPDYPKGELVADTRNPERSFQGSAADYVRLLKVAYTVVRWVDPGAQIVTGGLGFPSYLDELLEQGAANSFDAVDFHAYGGPGSDAALGSFLTLESKLRQVLRHAGLHKGMLCSETGYSSSEPDVQADYITKVYATGLVLGLEGVVYYSNTNPCWREMGLVDWRTMSQKTEGYWAYKTIARALSGMRFAGKLPLQAQLVGYRFVAPEGHREVQVVWAPFHPQSDAVPYRLTTPGTWRLVAPNGRTRPLRAHETLFVGERPLVLDSDPAIAYAPMRPNPPRYVGSFQLLAALADSSDPAGAPDLAVDGDLDSEWVSAHPGPSTYTLQLKRPERVRGIRLKTGPLGSMALDVLVSTDARIWHAPLSNLRISDWSAHDLAFGSSLEARYVRLYWHSRASKAAERAQLFEVELR